MVAAVHADQALEAAAGSLEEKREAYDAGASAWVSWNTDAYGNLYGTTSSATTAYIGNTWSNWNTVYTGTSGYGITYAGTSTQATFAPQWASWNTSYEETAEQEAARLDREAEDRRLAEERRAERDAQYAEESRLREEAKARSLELLRSLLSDEQWSDYTERGWFEVRGSRGGRWRIRNNGQYGNVDLMPEIGQERDVTYCAHPAGSLPSADAHAAQMLALVTDEEMFVRTANVHYRRQLVTEEELQERRRARQRMHDTARERVHAGTGPRGAAA
jgi:hypothetical protein